MLSRNPSMLSRVGQNATLLLTSLVFLPLSTLVLFLSYAVQILVPQNAFRRQVRRSPRFHPRTILVTGVATPQGLRIARAFHECGHNVIGADFEKHGIPVNGRVSRALKAFYPLRPPTPEYGSVFYGQSVLEIVINENVDLWISCSGLITLAQDGQVKELLDRKTSCKTFQLDVNSWKVFQSTDDLFRFTQSIGLPTPETHQVRSRDEVHHVLNGAEQSKKFIIKAPRVNGVGDEPIVLPQRTLSETYHHVSSIKVSKDEPLILQQYVTGEKYRTYSVVIEGKAKLFVASPSAAPLEQYQALPQKSGLNHAMCNFTETFARKLEPTFTGHLSFEFAVEERVSDRGLQTSILPTACNPRPHTTAVLFQGTRGSVDMVRTYLSAMTSAANGIDAFSGLYSTDDHPSEIALPHPDGRGIYWSGQDFVLLVLVPLFHLLTLRMGPLDFLHNVITFVDHVVFWNDATYLLWDPLPWWWLYHVYLPGRLLASLLTGKQQERLDSIGSRTIES